MRRLLLACAAAAALALPAVASARPVPVTWCGSDEIADNRVPDLEISSSAQVRFMYAIPSDGADNFAAYASGIATDAAWIDEWWRAQDPARAPRFDRYAFPGCTSRGGSIDLGVLRLPRDTAYYRSSHIFRLLTEDIGLTVPSTQKTIVYYDGAVSESRICGQSPSNERSGGRFGISYVYLRSSCELTPPGSTSAQVAAHELIHNFGALPTGAPHACADDDGHPCDSETDVLYPYLGNASTLDVVTLDFNRDDYYGHSGSWFDVQDSLWLTHVPQVPLTVTFEGSGSVVARTDSGPLPCDTGCSALELDSDLAVTIVAVPSAGWRVGGWSGACTQLSLSCSLTLTEPASVRLTFVRNPAVVSVRITGRGRVTSSPPGIACAGGTCRHSFTAGASVRLTAAPARGWRFAGWSGACTGRSRCALTADGGTVGARFARR